jgi:hypothetical protein
MTYSELREQTSKVGTEIDSKLAESTPGSLPIVELYEDLVGEDYDEKAIRTAMWDRINSGAVSIIGGSALTLVSDNY